MLLPLTDLNDYSSHLFPAFLSRPTSQTSGIKRSKIIKSPVITTSPSEDHTYSACLNQQECSPSVTSDDDGQHWSDDSKSDEANPPKEMSKVLKISKGSHISSKNLVLSTKNEEEEGAHALLNLAEIASKRLLRKTYSKLS